MKEVYVIHYWNGEHYDDDWSGILECEGAFLKREDAENRVIELQKQHRLRIKEEIERGYVFPFGENEKWEVRSIDIR